MLFATNPTKFLEILLSTLEKAMLGSRLFFASSEAKALPACYAGFIFLRLISLLYCRQFLTVEQITRTKICAVYEDIKFKTGSTGSTCCVCCTRCGCVHWAALSNIPGNIDDRTYYHWKIRKIRKIYHIRFTIALSFYNWLV